jgi:hypothetical protein
LVQPAGKIEPPHLLLLSGRIRYMRNGHSAATWLQCSRQRHHPLSTLPPIDTSPAAGPQRMFQRCGYRVTLSANSPGANERLGRLFVLHAPELPQAVAERILSEKSNLPIWETFFRNGKTLSVDELSSKDFVSLWTERINQLADRYSTLGLASVNRLSKTGIHHPCRREPQQASVTCALCAVYSCRFPRVASTVTDRAASHAGRI